MTGHQPYPAETVQLGAFDPLEAPIVIDLLAERGIFAFSKARLDQAESQPYGTIFGDMGRGRIFVDAARIEEARRIVKDELPQRIAEYQRALDEGFASEEMLVEPNEDDEED
jgi:hypothetical protein